MRTLPATRTPHPPTLEQLAASPDYMVRAGVAANPNTPASVWT